MPSSKLSVCSIWYTFGDSQFCIITSAARQAVRWSLRPHLPPTASSAPLTLRGTCEVTILTAHVFRKELPGEWPLGYKR